MKPILYPKNKLLNIVFVISLILVLFITLFGHYIPSLFSQGQKVEDLFSNLFFTIVTSYIFYYIVIFLKEHKDKKNLLPLILGYNQEILDGYKRFNKSLFEICFQHENNEQCFSSEGYLMDGGLNIDVRNLTRDNFRFALSLIDIEKTHQMRNPPHLLNITFTQYMVLELNKIEKNIDNLLLVSAHLDSEHVKLLYEIKTSELMKQISNDDFKYFIFYDDLTPLTRYVYQFHQSLNALNIYHTTTKP